MSAPEDSFPGDPFNEFDEPEDEPAELFSTPGVWSINSQPSIKNERSEKNVMLAKGRENTKRLRGEDEIPEATLGAVILMPEAG